MSWQHLKTGYSERSQASNSSSSLGFAIDCLNSSSPRGNLLFIDLRNRTVQRIQDRKERQRKSEEEKKREMERKAKEEVDAEMARLEKSWQCNRLSAFAHQCWTGLMRLLPRTWQITDRLRITEAQLRRHEQNNQTDEKEKNANEKTATKQAKLKNIFGEKRQPAKNDRREPIGEDRIQRAKFEWLKECQRIMRKGSVAPPEHNKKSFADTDNNKARKEWLDDFVKYRLFESYGAKACDTLDVCTLAFFIQAVRRSRADSGGELAFSPIWQAIDEAKRNRLTGDSSAPSWATGAPTKPPKASKGKAVNAEIMTRAELVPSATPKDIQELSFWLADQFVSHAFEVCYYYRKKQLTSKLFSSALTKKQIKLEWSFLQEEKQRTMEANLNFIFKSEKFQSCNVHNLYQVSCQAATLPSYTIN